MDDSQSCKCHELNATQATEVWRGDCTHMDRAERLLSNMGALEMTNSPKPVKSAKKLGAGKKLEKKTPLMTRSLLKKVF